MQAQATRSAAKRRIRPLPAEPNVRHIQEFAEEVAERTADSDVSFGWLKETLFAIPLPEMPEVPENLDLLSRHALLTYRIVRVRRMIAWLAQDVRECGYWKYTDVRAGFTDTLAGLKSLLSAMEAEFGRDAVNMTAPEESAIAFYYKEAQDAFDI